MHMHAFEHYAYLPPVGEICSKGEVVERNPNIFDERAGWYSFLSWLFFIAESVKQGSKMDRFNVGIRRAGNY